MARLPYLGPDDLAPENRDLLARDIHLARLLANSPGAARGMNGLAMWIRRDSKLDPRLRELAILQVGWCARSPYEWSHHCKIARDAGVHDDDIRAIAAESGDAQPAPGAPSLDPLARLVLRAARETARDGAMSADSVDALRAALGDERLMELVVMSSFYCGVVRVMASLAIDVEPEYQPMLEMFPLPTG